ncbi:energy transducer TonB [Sphingomonas koreensis]
MILLSTLALAAATSTPPQDDAAPAPLAADGSWVVDYADQACNVARAFGKGDQRVTFALVLMPGRETSQIVLHRPYDGKERIREAELVIATGPDAPPITTQAISGSVTPGTRLLHANITAEGLSQIENAKSLVFRHRDQVIHLATNGMKKPLAAALACEDDLLRTWGTDPATFRSIAVHAKAARTPDTWVTPEDYPAGSLMARESGVVGVRLSISAAGNLTECKIVASSKFPTLDKETCALIRKRARYEPARMADGAKVPSVSFLRFRWQILD